MVPAVNLCPVSLAAKPGAVTERERVDLRLKAIALRFQRYDSLLPVLQLPLIGGDVLWRVAR